MYLYQRSNIFKFKNITVSDLKGISNAIRLVDFFLDNISVAFIYQGLLSFYFSQFFGCENRIMNSIKDYGLILRWFKFLFIIFYKFQNGFARIYQQ